MNRIELSALLPLNLTDSTKHYFESRRNYSVRAPKIQFIKNAFVSEQGLVVKNFFLNRHCALNLLGKEDNTFYFPYWKLTLEQMLVAKFGKSIKSVQLNPKQQYLLIHSKWFNYSFWVNSCLVRLQMAEQAGLLNDVLLIYPEAWKNINFVNESISCFNVSKQTIPHDHHMFVPNLVMPETREWTASFNPVQIQNVRERVLPYALKNSEMKRFSKRIYLTRAKRTVRCVENEEEILPILKEFKFEIVSFENISFWDQVALMHHAEVFVSIHGAGFSNVMFMQPGASVLELINQLYAEVEYQFPFWKLSSAAQLNYYAQFCSIKTGASSLLKRGMMHDTEHKYLVNENIIVDKVIFRENIKKMCA
jgi:hypothetical protein